MINLLGQKWFEKQQRKELWIYALETRNETKPSAVPGAHRSYVSDGGTRLWAFKWHHDWIMAKRILEREIVR